MQPNLEVLFTPAEFDALQNRDLSNTVCVVFDVLRATTSMLAALGHGATQILPVKEISEALALQRGLPQAPCSPANATACASAPPRPAAWILTWAIPRANSRRSASPAATIIMTTTNGTRALQACLGARHILAGAFLNLAALARWIKTSRRPAFSWSARAPSSKPPTKTPWPPAP